MTFQYWTFPLKSGMCSQWDKQPPSWMLSLSMKSDSQRWQELLSILPPPLAVAAAPQRVLLPCPPLGRHPVCFTHWESGSQDAAALAWLYPSISSAPGMRLGLNWRRLRGRGLCQPQSAPIPAPPREDMGHLLLSPALQPPCWQRSQRSLEERRHLSRACREGRSATALCPWWLSWLRCVLKRTVLFLWSVLNTDIFRCFVLCYF